MTSIIEESQKARNGKLLGLALNKKIVISLLLVIVIIGSVYYFFFRKDTAADTTVQAKEWTVKKGDIQIGLDTTGQVVAEDVVQLSFSVSGDALEVENVYVKEGDKIKKGDKIASVKTQTLEYSVRSAYASYKSALETYNEKIAGATDNDIAKQKAAIEQAELSLEQSKISLEKTKSSAATQIANAEKAAADAKENLDQNRDALSSKDVNNAYDSLINTIKATLISLESILTSSDQILGIDNPELNNEFEQYLGTENSASVYNSKASYEEARDEIKELDSMTISLNSASSFSDIDKAAEQAQTALDEIETHLYNMQAMVRATVSSNDLSQTQIDSWKSSVNSNRNSVNSKILTMENSIKAVDTAQDGLDDYVTDYNDALKDIETAKSDAAQDIANAEANVRTRQLYLEDAQRTYKELIAPLTDAELASARSQLTSSAINLEKAQYELDKAMLASPIDGEIVQLNYKAGDIIIDATDPVAVILNTDTLYIELSVEESDINKIEVGQKAYATFDAAEGVELEGEISFISLRSSTDNNGIVTYPVRVIIDNTDKAKIREGMTASINFVTSGVTDVLIAPVEAIKNVEGRPSVQKDSGDWVAVTTGFTDGTAVEVISGLNDGDKLIYY